MATKKPLTMSELKKQLDREKKKEERKETKLREKEIKPKNKPKGLVSLQAAKQTKIKAKEEQARRTFFSQILKKQDSLSHEELLDELKKFGTEPNAQLFRKEFIKRISVQLSAGLIFEYAQDYLNQTESSNVYFEKFVNIPEVKERIRIISADKDEKDEKVRERDEEYEFETDEEENQELEDFLLEEEYEEGKFYPIIKSEKVAKLIHSETQEEIEMIPRSSLIKYAKMKNKRCIEWYRNTPWLEGRVTSIWIHPLDSNFPENLYHKTDDLENLKTINDIPFYRANHKFVKLQCGLYRNQRKQEGDVFTFYDEFGEPHEVNIVFEVRGKLIPQTEKIFQEEKDAYFQITGPIDKKVTKLTGRSVSMLSEGEKKELKKVMENNFSSLLKNDSKNYYERWESLNMSQKTNESFSFQVINIFFQKEGEGSVKLLLEKFSLFLAFFSEDFLEYAKTFKERLNKGIYTPEQLINLTYSEILPEVYLDPRVDNRNREIFTKFLSIVAKEFYVQLSYNFYYALNPNERRIVIPVRIPMITNTELPDDGLRGICKNKNEIPQNISPYNLYIYQKGDEYYCFDLSNLPDDFLFGRDTEDDEIPEEIWEEINKLSEKYEAEKEVVLPPIDEKPENKLALAFLRIVIEDVLDLEDEIGIKGQNLIDELNKAKKEEDKSPNTKMTEKIEQITDKLENICGYCQEFMDRGQPGIFSSIVQGKDGSKLIDFCNIECFEKMEKWPKLRKRKEKLEEQARAKMETRTFMEKPKEIKEEEVWSEQLPCFYPGDCETNPAFSDKQIRQIAEECEVPIRTPKGLRIRKNLCKDIKEKTRQPDIEYDCNKCKVKITEGQERNLEKDVFCQKCYFEETMPLIKKINKKEEKMAKEKEKICIQCEKFIGENPAWRSSDWGHGIVHYCSLKCFQEFDPDTALQVNQIKEIEEEKRKKLDEIVKKAGEYKKPGVKKHKN